MTRFSQRWVFAVGLACLLASAPTSAQTSAEGGILNTRARPLDLNGLYQRPDGAITVLINGDVIDPYFSSKALLSAAYLNVDARATTQAWIHWLLAYQHPDGRFDRYCIKAGQYSRCKEADADDAMMAVWIELLLRSAPAGEMPPRWRDSIEKSHRYLTTLRDPRTGVYQISRTLPVALLMDNVEIYSALRTLAEYRANEHDEAGAKQAKADADALGRAILTTFWSPDRGFRASTQVVNDSDFYPTRVAQLFPLMSDMPVPGQNRAATYRKWMRENCRTWLSMPTHDYPWGLVALAAYKAGDTETAACWHATAGAYRHGAHWNVLEETVYVAIDQQMVDPLAPAQCCPDKTGGAS
ncbi:conserved exported protein of unknown function [Pararobbsia alpina]|uniref:MGH1-like glycoside hydrolase domain-containing protein n=1 Tax=Pararobbsia alpina TaxID=621374 RepID=UPI0039A400EA